MFTLAYGDIFKSKAQVLVCPVNRVGVMGAGLALDFNKRYPGLVDGYQNSCHRGSISKGELYFHAIGEGGFVLCFPTKHDWRENSTLHLIEAGLNQTLTLAEKMNLISFAFPALGCGLGGLLWGDVLPLMHAKLQPAPFDTQNGQMTIRDFRAREAPVTA